MTNYFKFIGICLLIQLSGCGRASFDQIDGPERENSLNSQDTIVRVEGNDVSVGNSDVVVNPDSVTVGGETTPDSGGRQPPQRVELVKEFPLNLEESQSILKDLNAELMQLNIQMQDEAVTENLQESFNQITRKVINEGFIQGNSGREVEDRFEQNRTGLLDILLVIDDSASMKEEQVLLAEKLQSLLQHIQGVDWRIGVVTTSAVESCSKYRIYKTDANYEQKFHQIITNIGLNGDGNERGFYAAAEGLKCSDRWVRRNSGIAVVIVSDEDNCSDRGVGCQGEAWETPGYLIRTFIMNMGRKVGTEARVYSIIAQPGGDANCGERPGFMYSAASKITNGLTGSICGDSDEFSQTLERISLDFTNIVSSDYNLSENPTAGSVKVYINDVEMQSGFRVENQKLSFDLPLPASASIRVVYKVDASIVRESYSLSIKPLQNSVQVKIDRVAQKPNTYVVDYNNKKIKFLKVPADSSVVDISYKEDIPLRNIFKISSPIEANSLKAYVGNNQVSIVIFDSNNGYVQLRQAPAEGSRVKFTYAKVTGRKEILEYPLVVPWGEARGIIVSDGDTNQPIPFSYINGKISFGKNEFIIGRKVQISIFDESNVQNEIEFSQIPIKDSIVVALVDSLNQMKPCESENLVVDGKKLTINCDLYDIKSIKVDLKFTKLSPNTFDMGFSEIPVTAKWEVWLDDQVLKNFKVEKGIITILDDISQASKIKVRVVYN